jgi:hypothetical protein
MEEHINRATGAKVVTKVPISFRTKGKCDVTKPQNWAPYPGMASASAATNMRPFGCDNLRRISYKVYQVRLSVIPKLHGCIVRGCAMLGI